jgi:hypothetical protein
MRGGGNDATIAGEDWRLRPPFLFAREKKQIPRIARDDMFLGIAIEGALVGTKVEGPVAQEATAATG